MSFLAQQGASKGPCWATNDMFWTYIFFQKGHPNQKGGCPDTLDTPWIRHWHFG